MIGLLFLALAATSVTEERANARSLAEAAAGAWNEGRLGEAGTHAAAAYDALTVEGCLVTRDGARLAFIAGVVGLAGQIQEPQSYFFWAARQLDRAAGGLTVNERRLTREYGIELGRLPRLDPRYARSPFLTNPRPRRARNCPDILPALEADPALPQAGILIARTRNPNGAYTPLQAVYAYPDRVRARAPEITGTYNFRQSSAYRGLHYFVFDPCLTVYDQDRQTRDICLDGAPAP
ncbi:MAG: hypothetical protein LAT81_04595 [Oceanicaulis sp.]|nr:hypothetical protein [Oceanicaulis sp.]